MCSDQSSVHDTQEFLKAYFQKTFEHWADSYKLPRKMLAKVDERKLPYAFTAMGVIDAEFYNVLCDMDKEKSCQKVNLDNGVVNCFDEEGTKLTAFNAHVQYNSLLFEFLNGMLNIHLVLQATEAYSFERSVYGFWLHDLDAGEFNFHFYEGEFFQIAKNLKGHITQKLFFDREANERWNAAAEHERYAAMGTWAAEQDLQ